MPQTVVAPTFLYHGAELGTIIIVRFLPLHILLFQIATVYVTGTINQYIIYSLFSSQITSYKLDTHIIGPQAHLNPTLV